MARRADHTRQELKEITLLAATNIIEQEGLSALTARHLAKKIGYTPGTLYNLFGSMDGLIYTINMITLDKIESLLVSLSAKNVPSNNFDFLKKMAVSYIEFAHKNQALWLTLFNAPLTQDPPLEYAKKLESIFLPAEHTVGLLLNNPSKAEIKKATHTLWASIHGICYLEITQKGPMRKSRQNAQTMSFYLIERFFSEPLS